MTGEKIYFPQKIVCIAGKEAKVRLVNAGRLHMEISSFPDSVKPLHLFKDGNDLVLTLLGVKYQPVPEPLVFSCDGDEESTECVEVTVPVRVFTDKEFFLVFALQANLHEGWDPAWLHQYYPEMLDGRLPELALMDNGKLGPGARGSSFRYLYSDEVARKEYGVSFKPLENIYHENGISISWLIDSPVAGAMRSKLIDWFWIHGDTYSVMPSSYHDHNMINYNVQRSENAAYNLLKGTWDAVLEEFSKSQFPRYAVTAGVDQWVGGVGSHFVRAAINMGLNGLWGMAWDHAGTPRGTLCHRGAPWDAYKPSKYQYRVPIRENEKHELFLFPWTSRDIVNTLHLSPFGSNIFSTDPDDLRANDILKQVQPHYILEMLYNYLKNMKYNDYFVFIVHQEDHDAHFKENNIFLEAFVKEFVDEKPPGVTVATIDEVAQWLAIKFPESTSSSQALELEDPLLSRIRKKVRAHRLSTILQKFDPKDDDELERILVEHFPTSRLPTHVCFFDRDLLFQAYKPHRFPALAWDYSAQEQWKVPETGNYPVALLPELRITKEETSRDTFVINVISNRFYTRLPLVSWNPPFTLKRGISKRIGFQLENVAVTFLNLKIGENEIDFSSHLE